MIYTEEEIEREVRKLPTTQKRINARKRLRKESDAAIDLIVGAIRSELRGVVGYTENDKTPVYAIISRLERKRHAG